MGGTMRALSHDGQPERTSRIQFHMPHSIRLRGPWQYEVLALAVADASGGLILADSEVPPPGVIELPGDWSAALGADFRGLARLTRRFGLPTGLSQSSRVWLAIEGVAGTAAVALNSQTLGNTTGVHDFSRSPQNPVHLSQPFASLFQIEPEPCPVRWDITKLLQPRNEVAIILLALEAGRVGLVSLEIED